jgi:hypothetical protein
MEPKTKRSLRSRSTPRDAAAQTCATGASQLTERESRCDKIEPNVSSKLRTNRIAPRSLASATASDAARFAASEGVRARLTAGPAGAIADVGAVPGVITS